MDRRAGIAGVIVVYHVGHCVLLLLCCEEVRAKRSRFYNHVEVVLVIEDSR